MKALFSHILLWMIFETGSSYRILFIPIQQMSHIESMTLIGQELGRRGHESYIMLMEKFKFEKIRRSSNSSTEHTDIHYFHASTDTYDGRPVEEHIEEFSEKLLQFSHSPRDLADIVISRHSDYCEQKLQRIDESFEELIRLNLDLVVVDIAVFSKCFLLVPFRLGIPWVTYTDYPDVLGMRFPWMPSIVPHHLSRFSDRMSLWQRFVNAFIYIITPSLMPDFPISDSLRRKYDPKVFVSSFDELTRQSKLFLLTSHPVLDYPKPVLPNMIQIGGVTVRRNKTLSPELEEFITSSKDGVILVSLGSMFSSIPSEMVQRFSQVFQNLTEFRILWRLKRPHNVTLPENVMISEWLPQMDVLSHERTKLFITHCGNNGQFEAMFSKVPMIGMPIFGDQLYNAQRMLNKGFGLFMDISTFTPEDLVANVRTVIHDPGYRNRLSKASEFFQDSPETPRELAARWLERILKHDPDMLGSAGMKLRIHEYWMLDVLLLSIVTVICLVTFNVAAVICCYRGIRQIKRKSKIGYKKEKIQ